MARPTSRNVGGEIASNCSSESARQRQALFASFGNDAYIRIPIDPSLSGKIIGRKGCTAKRICRTTKLRYFTVADAATALTGKDALVMEGSVDAIIAAVQMVRQVLSQESTAPTHDTAVQEDNYKTKICLRFANRSCSYGARCRFAHGEGELR